MAVETGLDNLIADPSPIKGRKWALLANQATVTTDLEPARTAIARAAGPPALLFAPEHGLDGVAQDMESVGDEVDPLTGTPVRSLYGHDAASLAPRSADLGGLDVVAVDVPDIGSRYYTFAATMDALMKACSAAGVEILVLDRPNPIGGVAREGGLVRPGFESFVGQIPTPTRHGLTLAEIALLLHRERYPDLELTVVGCRGWPRGQLFDATGLPWVAPSPNMPTLDTALIYPGLCLVEGTNISEGRGTTLPFHLVGAPWVDAEAVVEHLRALPISGAAFRATRFRPEFSKHAGDNLRGHRNPRHGSQRPRAGRPRYVSIEDDPRPPPRRFRVAIRGLRVRRGHPRHRPAHRQSRKRVNASRRAPASKSYSKSGGEKSMTSKQNLKEYSCTTRHSFFRGIGLDVDSPPKLLQTYASEKAQDERTGTSSHRRRFLSWPATRNVTAPPTRIGFHLLPSAGMA